MPFRPKRLVNPGLYATNDDFIEAESGKVYRGPYHTTFDNQIFSGVDSYDPNKKSLAPNPAKSLPRGNTTVLNLPQNNSYNDLKKGNNNVSLLKYGRDPESFTPRPTEQDYRRGNITRYFAKRITEKPPRIREISETAFNSLSTKDKSYNYAVWREYKIVWRISGPEQQIRSTNQKIVDRANKTFRGIKSYLRNLVQFYKAPEETPDPVRTFRDEPRQPSIRRSSGEGGGPRRIPPDLY